jgi:hypothetical protein
MGPEKREQLTEIIVFQILASLMHLYLLNKVRWKIPRQGGHPHRPDVRHDIWRMTWSVNSYLPPRYYY